MRVQFCEICEDNQERTGVRRMVTNVVQLASLSRSDLASISQAICTLVNLNAATKYRYWNVP